MPTSRSKATQPGHLWNNSRFGRPNSPGAGASDSRACTSRLAPGHRASPVVRSRERCRHWMKNESEIIRDNQSKYYVRVYTGSCDTEIRQHRLKMIKILNIFKLVKCRCTTMPQRIRSCPNEIEIIWNNHRFGIHMESTACRPQLRFLRWFENDAVECRWVPLHWHERTGIRRDHITHWFPFQTALRRLSPRTYHTYHTKTISKHIKTWSMMSMSGLRASRFVPSWVW